MPRVNLAYCWKKVGILFNQTDSCLEIILELGHIFSLLRKRKCEVELEYQELIKVAKKFLSPVYVCISPQ